MNHTELDIIVAELMFPILVELAPTGETIRYKELADLIKERNPHVPEIKNIMHRHIGRKLGTIWEFTKGLPECPHIGSLVVNESGECGTGIQSEVPDLPAEREKVRNFDWSQVSLSFDTYLSKVKQQKQERELKRVKRSRDEAKACVVDYWKAIKDEAPVSRSEIESLRETLFKQVEDGDSPEEAFAAELLKLIDAKPKTRPEDGFVYLGEYQNSETSEPLFNQFKIGYTTNCERRIKELGGGVEGPLVFNIIAYWKFSADVAYAVEQAMHGKFSRHRKNGEFFDGLDRVLPGLVDDAITHTFGELLIETNFDEEHAVISDY